MEKPLKSEEMIALQVSIQNTQSALRFIEKQIGDLNSFSPKTEEGKKHRQSAVDILSTDLAQLRHTLRTYEAELEVATVKHIVATVDPKTTQVYTVEAPQTVR